MFFIFFIYSTNLDLLVVVLEITKHVFDLLQSFENIYFHHFPNSALGHLKSTYISAFYIIVLDFLLYMWFKYLLDIVLYKSVYWKLPIYLLFLLYTAFSCFSWLMS